MQFDAHFMCWVASCYVWPQSLLWTIYIRLCRYSYCIDRWLVNTNESLPFICHKHFAKIFWYFYWQQKTFWMEFKDQSNQFMTYWPFVWSVHDDLPTAYVLRYRPIESSMQTKYTHLFMVTKKQLSHAHRTIDGIHRLYCIFQNDIYPYSFNSV